MSTQPPTLKSLSTTLKSLHPPSAPLILPNIYDAPSAKTIANLPSSHTLATASYAVAEAAGTTDDDLPLDELLRSAKIVGKVIRPFEKSFTVDLRDGYGDALEGAVKVLIEEAGVVGVNLEDFNAQDKKFYSMIEAAGRIRRVLRTAGEAGVPDFVVNARCDVLVHGGDLEDVIERGKAYLDPGATTMFVWGGVKREEVVKLAAAFGGRLNVLRNENGLSVRELAEIGVARVSVGSLLQGKALERIREVAGALLEY